MSELKGLELLRKPFSDNEINLLPKPFSKDSPKGTCAECGGYHGLPAVHLKYVGHAALTNRLLDVDPQWNWEPMTYRDGLPAFDSTGGLWIKLTICGLTRIGYGAAAGSSKDVGAREKEVIGDALRNAAMRFGAALDLWHKGDLNEETKDSTLIKSPTPYVIPFGKHKGKRLSQLTVLEITKYIEFITNSAKSSNKPVTGPGKEFMEKAEVYLDAMSSGAIPAAKDEH